TCRSTWFRPGLPRNLRRRRPSPRRPPRPAASAIPESPPAGRAGSWPLSASALRLAELEQELVAGALHREHLGFMRVVRVTQHLARRDEHEAHARDFLLHELRIDTVQ